MNKKLMLPLMIILGIGVVAAISYYALFSATFTVLPSITLSEECDDSLGEVYDGDSVEGSECVITNDAPTERELTLSNDAIEGIDVSYLGALSLTKKDTTTWEVIGEPIEITYTIIGDEFEVTGVPEEYSLIYYKDDESNVDDEDRLLTIGEIGLTDTNLPHSNDWNVGELADYCDFANGYDDYNQCKGAKLWVVPTADIIEDTLNWANMANYYYELDLIQYNSEGQIVLYPGASLTITPVYDIGAGVSGEQTVTTTIA